MYIHKENNNKQQKPQDCKHSTTTSLLLEIIMHSNAFLFARTQKMSPVSAMPHAVFTMMVECQSTKKNPLRSSFLHI